MDQITKALQQLSDTHLRQLIREYGWASEERVVEGAFTIIKTYLNQKTLSAIVNEIREYPSFKELAEIDLILNTVLFIYDLYFPVMKNS